MSSGQGQPVQVQPVQVNPVPVESVSVGPVQVEPVKVEPVRVELAWGTQGASPKPIEVHKAEATLLGKIQRYSTEILRISLAGIALLGFFFDKVAERDYLHPAESKRTILMVMGIAATLFAVAAAASLAHRYYSTNAMYYGLRILQGETHFPNTNPTDKATLHDYLFWCLIKCRLVEHPTNEHKSMIKETSRISDLAIGLAAICAALASFTLVIAFYIAQCHFCPQQKPAEQRSNTINIINFSK
jgi:hypothetical protein